MRFVRIPVAEAEGSVLAHTLRAGGTVFVRGRRLIADDLRILGEHGADELSVAQLDPGDIDHDTAASRIADRLCGAGLHVSEPLQGRCRLIAEASGLLRLDPARVDAFNAVDEAALLASLAPHEAVNAGETVASLRILPFALHEERLRACLDRLDAPPILDLAEYRPFRASLLLTRYPSTSQAQLAQWASLVGDCLAAVGGVLAESRDGSLDEGTLREHLADVDPAADIVLVAGPSSPLHPGDPLPTVLRSLGGRIVRHGVPTDPGSQLIWAMLDGRPVVGLPACSQPAQLRGFEPLLRRFAAGLDVSAAAIAAVGVGGLRRTHHLDEDEDLPLPVGRPPRVAAVVVAASRSPRQGETTRLLAPVDGEPMIRHAVRAALAARTRPVIVVAAADEGEAIGNALLGLDGVKLVHAPPALTTLGEMAGIGLAAVPPAADGAVIQPGDMPFLRGDEIDALVDAFDPRTGPAICLPTFRGRRGHPILYDRRFFAEITAPGDGLARVVAAHGEAVHEVATDHPGILMDLDTLDTLSAWSASA